MKVYTKTGDKGTTALIGGRRVLKSDLRIEAYGTVDELNSYIGLLRDQKVDESDKDLFIEIQDRLFTLGAELATDPQKKQSKIPVIVATDVERLENEMDVISESLPPLHAFILPGGDASVSFCHIARCVCRRAERLTVALSEIAEVDALVLKYLNRLSDYLFVLSRKWSVMKKAEEIEWKPRKA